MKISGNLWATSIWKLTKRCLKHKLLLFLSVKFRQTSKFYPIDFPNFPNIFCFSIIWPKFYEVEKWVKNFVFWAIESFCPCPTHLLIIYGVGELLTANEKIINHLVNQFQQSINLNDFQCECSLLYWVWTFSGLNALSFLNWHPFSDVIRFRPWAALTFCHAIRYHLESFLTVLISHPNANIRWHSCFKLPIIINNFDLAILL